MSPRGVEDMTKNLLQISLDGKKDYLKIPISLVAIPPKQEAHLVVAGIEFDFLLAFRRLP